jgi:hypothetical protein
MEDVTRLRVFLSRLSVLLQLPLDSIDSKSQLDIVPQ